MIASVLSLFVALSGLPASAAAAGDPAAARSAWYQRHVARHPSAWGARLEWARVDLARASATLDPLLLARAREQVRLSLETQVSAEGWKMAARVESFAHRFEPALGWARRAAEAIPEDAEALGLVVEALLGLGRVADAEAALAAFPQAATEFHALAAAARVLAARERPDDAVAAFLRAADVAGSLDAPELEAWALVQAAGVRIDAGRAGEAAPLLRRASALDPRGREVLLHQAEASLAAGDAWEALAACREILRGGEDVEALLLAHRAARVAGARSLESAYFLRARARIDAAMASGETHALGARERLTADAGP